MNGTEEGGTEVACPPQEAIHTGTVDAEKAT